MSSATYLLLFALSLVTVELVIGKPCDNLPPGLGRIFRGVDLTSLDLYHYTRDTSTLLDGLRSVLLKPTCDEGHTWNVGNVTYSRPDQVAQMNSTQSVKKPEIRVTMCADVDCFKNKILLDGQLLIGSDVSPGAFSSCARFKGAQKEILRKKYVFAEVSC